MIKQEALDLLRNIAPRIGKTEVKRVMDTVEYAPPVRRRPEDRTKVVGATETEYEISPIITGLHDKEKKQQPRISGDTSGQGIGFAGTWDGGVGAHRT